MSSATSPLAPLPAANLGMVLEAQPSSSRPCCSGRQALSTCRGMRHRCSLSQLAMTAPIVAIFSRAPSRIMGTVGLDNDLGATASPPRLLSREAKGGSLPLAFRHWSKLPLPPPLPGWIQPCSLLHPASKEAFREGGTAYVVGCSPHPDRMPLRISRKVLLTINTRVRYRLRAAPSLAAPLGLPSHAARLQSPLRSRLGACSVDWSKSPEYPFRGSCLLIDAKRPPLSKHDLSCGVQTVLASMAIDPLYPVEWGCMSSSKQSHSGPAGGVPTLWLALF